MIINEQVHWCRHLHRPCHHDHHQKHHNLHTIMMVTMPICDDQRGRGNLGWGWSDTREGGERGGMERWEHLIIIFNLIIIFMIEIVNLGRLSLLLWSLVSIYVDQNDTKVHQIWTIIYSIRVWVVEMCQSNLLFHSRDECIPSEENVFPGKRGPITNKAAPHSLPPSSLPPTPVSERRITASNQGQARTQKKFKLTSESSSDQVQ